MASKDAPTKAESRSARRRRKRYRFPARAGNHLEFFPDPDAWFETALAHIGAARHYILLEIYLISSGETERRFHAALREAARRGVSVHFLYDDYGGRGLSSGTRAQLRADGVDARPFNPFRRWHWQANLHRDHRKLLLVDGETAFVTGAGLTDDFSRRFAGERWWRDTALQVNGPVVADCFTLFADVWRHAGGKLDVAPLKPRVFEDGTRARLLVAQPGHNEIQRALLRHLRRAKTRVWLTTPYFVPPRKLLRALRRTARRGVEVTLLLPGDRNDHPWVTWAARGLYQRLLRDGIRIFEFRPAFTHAKLVLIDNWATGGSSNLDRWDQRWNLDANLAFGDCGCLSSMEDWFRENFAQCEEIRLETWRQRPWHQRIREMFARRLVNLLERIGRNRRKRRLGVLPPRAGEDNNTGA